MERKMDCPPFKTKEELIAIEFPSAAITQSYSDWLFDQGKEELKDQWEKEAAASNQKGGIALRVNRLLLRQRK